MTFTVTYRDASGSTATAYIDAKGRAECFAECKARGIVPVAIKEGGRAKVALSSKRSWPWWKAVAAFVALLAIGLGAWLWLSGDKPAPTSAPPKISKPQAPKKKPVAKSLPATNAAPKVVTLRKRHRKPKTVPVATADVGTPPDLPMFEDAPRRYGEINGSNIWPRALFKTREENMIAGLLTAKPGYRVVVNGFLPGEDKRLLESLDVPVEFEDIDTPAEREMKEYMIGVKADLKKAVANGEKITDIVQSLRDELNELANYRDKLRMAHHLMTKEGTPEEAEKFRQEANAMLKEYGMDPIPIRSTQRARLGQVQ